ncbi:MAG: hypothetical protein Q9M36_08595 [Sulfurovum sp.]|nr:hypothetical protein [Sulfurovum sp.]
MPIDSSPCKCHICDALVKTFRDSKTAIVYYHCISCEYIFKSPSYYQDFTGQKERYNHHTNNEDDEGYIAYFQRFFRFSLAFYRQAKECFRFWLWTKHSLGFFTPKRGDKL